MHISYVFVILDHSYPKGIHNIILGVFDMVLKDGPVIPPHVFPQLKPQPFLEVGKLLFSSHHHAINIVFVYLDPSPELLHSYTLSFSKGPLIPCILPSRLLEPQ